MFFELPARPCLDSRCRHACYPSKAATLARGTRPLSRFLSTEKQSPRLLGEPPGNQPTCLCFIGRQLLFCICRLYLCSSQLRPGGNLRLCYLAANKKPGDRALLWGTETERWARVARRCYHGYGALKLNIQFEPQGKTVEIKEIPFFISDA